MAKSTKRFIDENGRYQTILPKVKKAEPKKEEIKSKPVSIEAPKPVSIPAPKKSVFRSKKKVVKKNLV